MANNCCPLALDNLLKGGCDAYRAGLLDEIYVVSRCNIDTITSSTNDKEYDDITMKIDAATTAPFYWFRIQFKKNTAGLTSEAQIGVTKHFNQSITFQHEGITKESLAVLQSMITGEAVFIAKDYSGKVHLLGRIGGLEMEAASTGTGAGADDMYGSEVTFSGLEPEMHNLIASGTQIEVWDGTATETVTL